MINSNKALFLDRDGVINRERGEYTFLVEDFEILPTVIPTLKLAQKLGYLLIIITNQGGIAKGLYSHQDVENCHSYLKEELHKEGIILTDVFYSPHHQDYSKSLDRKPGSLMLEKAMAIHKVDPHISYMVGDSLRDIEASEAVSVKGFLIKPNSNLEFLRTHLS